jgi:hypothetical protein
MAKVLTHMTMSLDGFIANPGDVPEELFDWYSAGEVPVPSLDPDMSFQVDLASAEVLRELLYGNGAIVAGGACSTSPTAGATTTPAPPGSWS